MCPGDQKWGSTKSFRGVPGWGGLELGRDLLGGSRILPCSASTGTGTWNLVPKVLQKAGERSTRMLYSTPRHSPPSPLDHPPLHAAGARQCSTAMSQSTAPRAGGGPNHQVRGRVTGARSRLAGRGSHGPGALGLAQPEARAGVTGLWAAGTVPELERLASAPSPKPWVGARPGRAHHALRAHQHPDPHGEYPRPASWEGVGWGRVGAEGASTAPWRLPLGQRPPETGPGSRPGHAPSGRRLGAGERTQLGTRGSGSSDRHALPGPRSG